MMSNPSSVQNSKLNPDRICRVMNLINAANPEYQNGSAVVPLDSVDFKITISLNGEVDHLYCVKTEIKKPATLPRVVKGSNFNLIGKLACKLDTEEYCELRFQTHPSIGILQQKYHLIVQDIDLNGEDIYAVFKFSPSIVKLMIFPMQFVHDQINYYNSISTNNKIPLVLDLDDTVVRAVSIRQMDSSPRVIAMEQVPYITHRIKSLALNHFGVNKIALATNVDIFLQQISQKYDIVVCSAGGKEYVEYVCYALDPDGIYFKEIESTRHMHEYNVDKSLPTKDLSRLYPFCIPWDHHILSANYPPILAMTRQVIIIDDMDKAWLSNQRSQVYLMLPTCKIWDVDLELCAITLQHIYDAAKESELDIPFLLKNQMMLLAHRYYRTMAESPISDEESVELEDVGLDDPVDEKSKDSMESIAQSIKPAADAIPEGVQELFPNQEITLVENYDRLPEVAASISKFK
eukprot:NODE_614_length_5976_cov_0.280755.p1 type:complete len:462 gc:universal NODE_614_length_5976_cov_0.280755:4073-2688(-)